MMMTVAYYDQDASRWEGQPCLTFASGGTVLCYPLAKLQDPEDRDHAGRQVAAACDLEELEVQATIQDFLTQGKHR